MRVLSVFKPNSPKLSPMRFWRRCDLAHIRPRESDLTSSDPQYLENTMKYPVLVAAFVAVILSPASAKPIACKKAIGPCTYYMSVQRIQTDTAPRIQVKASDPFENMHQE
jgi:hypothetical protein